MSRSSKGSLNKGRVYSRPENNSNNSSNTRSYSRPESNSNNSSNKARNIQDLDQILRQAQAVLDRPTVRHLAHQGLVLVM